MTNVIRRRTTLLMRAYRVLAAIDNEWPTRNTPEGQSLLLDLRDAIAEETGMEHQYIQDEASWPLVGPQSKM